jgi:hypothetical protein
MPSPTVINQYRFSDVINRALWDNTYFFDDFKFQPISAKVGGGAATGTAGDNNVLFTQLNAWQWNVIGTQTILAPSNDSFGLNLVQDANAGDGIELCLGQDANNPATYIVGESNAISFEMNFKCNDVSGVNPLIIGLRKVQSFNATLSTYTDFVALGIVGTAAKFQIETQIASGGVVTTDTTQVAQDNVQFRLKINVSSTGVVTYQINSQTPTVVAAYTFANGLQIMPFIRMVEASDVAEQCSTNYFSLGTQS